MQIKFRAKQRWAQLMGFVRTHVGVAREKIRLLYTEACYFYRSRRVQLTFKLRAAMFWFARKSEYVYRGIYLTISLVGMLLLYRLGPHPLLTIDMATQFFPSAGAMIGGAVAIIFSLSVFALQTAADKYSAGIFRAYANNHRERIFYFSLSIFSLMLFGLGLLYTKLGESAGTSALDSGAYLGLLLIMLSFLLIQILYTDVKKRVDPVVALRLFRKRITKQMKLMKKDAERIAYASRPAKDVSQEKFAKLNLSVSYQQAEQHLSLIDKHLNELFEITRKLIERNEIDNAKLGLNAISATICEYMVVRRDSAVILPTGYLAHTSDVNRFVNRNLERFMALGIQQLESGFEIVVQDIVAQFVQLAHYAKDIKYVNDLVSDNPVLEMTMGYLNQLLAKAATHKKIDALLDGVRATANIGHMIVEKKNSTLLSGWHGDMYKLAIFGLTLQPDVLTQEAQNLWVRILPNVLLDARWDGRMHLKMLLEKIVRITLLHKALPSDQGLGRGFSIANIQCAPYEYIQELIANIAVKFDDQPTETQQHILHTYCDYLSEFYTALRSIAEKTSGVDGLLVGSLLNIITDIGYVTLHLAHDSSWKEKRSALLAEVSSYVNLPPWFYSETEMSNDHEFGKIADAMTKIGIEAIVLGEGKIANEAADATYWVVNKILKGLPKVGQFVEPRVIDKNVYLGVLALKMKNDDLFIKIGLQIYEFEDAYDKKHVQGRTLPPEMDPKHVIGFPDREQLFIEVLRWRDDFARDMYNRTMRRDDARGRVQELIELIDIDRFIFEIWGAVTDHSEFKRELERKVNDLAKSHNMRRLAKVLRMRVQSLGAAESTADNQDSQKDAENET